MNKLTIDKHIELPKVRRRSIYPYGDMDIGDSFYIPEVNMQVVCNNNYRVNKKTGMKFIARKEGDGVRVWRTA